MTTVSPKPTSLVAEAGASYFPIALIARLPFSMMVVGVLTLVVAGRDSIALGGLNSAMVGLGSAVAGPFLGMAADRFGQRPAMLVAGIGNSLALLAMALVVYSPAPDGLVLATAFFVGATAPQVAPMSRSRLVGIIRDRLPAERRDRVLNGTMAYESAADEVVFVFGPVIVGALATAFSPAAPMIGAAALTAVFVTAFALHRSADVVKPGQRAHEGAADPVSHLFRPGVIVVVLGMLGIGLFFGATLTSLTAFMEARGAGEQTGLLYGKGFEQTLVQIVISLVCLAVTGVLTTLIALALEATMGWRVDEDDEVAGIDQSEHAESAYDFGGFASGHRVSHGILPSGHGPTAAGGTIAAEHNDPTGVRS